MINDFRLKLGLNRTLGLYESDRFERTEHQSFRASASRIHRLSESNGRSQSSGLFRSRVRLFAFHGRIDPYSHESVAFHRRTSRTGLPVGHPAGKAARRIRHRQQNQ